MTRILIADSYPDGAESLAVLLRYRGYEVDVALDGPAALRAAQAHCPAVVVMDVVLALLDGCEVARRLRQASTSARPLLVALTADHRSSTQHAAAAAGFDFFLLKPVAPPRLEALLPPPEQPSAKTPDAAKGPRPPEATDGRGGECADSDGVTCPHPAQSG